MPVILRKLPFFDHPTVIQLRGQSIPVKADQIIVWVSLSEIGLEEVHRDRPRFPAILDTGCNHSFAIRQQHLIEWSGVQAELMPRLRPVHLQGVMVPQLAASVWLYPNRPGQRDEFSGQPPYHLETDQGIAVVPASAPGPRLPLLGLRALRWNHLQLAIDGDHCHVNVRTRRRFLRFLFG